MKIVVGTLKGLLWLVWFCLVRATFLLWLAVVWVVLKVPGLNQAIKMGPPAVPIVLTLLSVVIVGRFLVWLLQMSAGQQLSTQPPPKRQPSLLYHKVGW